MLEIIPNLHPIFVHFTVALISSAIGLFLIAWFIGKKPIQKQLLTVANWNLWLGAGFTIITIAAGWFAYNTVTHDTASHIVMDIHRNLALATLVVILSIAFWSWKYQTKIINPILLLAVLSLLMTTAWYGGELVYRHGIGVMSLPNTEVFQGPTRPETDDHNTDNHTH
ncbi:MAG: DUF2231 domain-containing protein [Candidatus Marithrix sp.]